MDGGPGTDTVSYAASTAAVTVNLKSGFHYGGHANGDVLKNIENVTGSRYGDDLTGDDSANTLLGGDGNDRLTGLGGADTLDGGDGRDVVSYYASKRGVTVNLTTGKGSGGDAEGDTLRNIETIVGSRLSDTLTGDEKANTFNGSTGADTIDGRGGGTPRPIRIRPAASMSTLPVAAHRGAETPRATSCAT